jgi:hypothetical protein
MIGEPDAGNLHVRFDEGTQETDGNVPRLRPTLQRPRVKQRTFVVVARLMRSRLPRIDRGRRFVSEALIKALVIIEAEPACDAGARFHNQ